MKKLGPVRKCDCGVCKLCLSRKRQHTCYWRNREKRLAWSRQWAAQNKARHHYYASRQDAKRKGHQPIALTLEEFVVWYEARKDQTRCDWCGDVMEKRCVDHDHETGQIRGVICNPCNLAEGWVAGRRARWEAIGNTLRPRQWAAEELAESFGA